MPTASENLVSFELTHREFDRAVGRFMGVYSDSASNAVKRVGFELLRRTIIRTTRVKTGRMKNGWHITFHRPSTWIPATGTSPKPSRGRDSNVMTLFFQNNVFYACVKGNTEIMTVDGIRNIDNIKPRQQVLGREGWQKVKAAWKYEYNDDMAAISWQGRQEPLTCTPEHNILILERKRCPIEKSYVYWCKENCKFRNRSLSECKEYWRAYWPRWKEAKDISVSSDMVLSSIFSPSLLFHNIKKEWGWSFENNFGKIEQHKVRNIFVSPEFMRLVGYFIAEGNIDKDHYIAFAFHQDETDYIDDVTNLMKGFFGCKSRYDRQGPGKGVAIKFCSRLANLFFRELGKRAPNKRLLPWMLELPQAHQVELLKGLFNGDGWVNNNENVLATTSRTLANQVYLISERLGAFPRLFSRAPNKGNFCKEIGRQIVGKHRGHYVGISRNDACIIGLRDECPSIGKNTEGWHWKNFVGRRVKDIATVPSDGYVFDLTMVGAPQFRANGIQVHNSYHEFGTETLSPLLMLSKSVAELTGELERYLAQDIEPLWNREINGITGGGLTAAAQAARQQFLRQRFGR